MTKMSKVCLPSGGPYCALFDFACQADEGKEKQQYII